MPHTQTHITLLIDQTASMFPYTTQVVDGLNYYVEALCAQTPGPVFATLKTFAEAVTTHYEQRPVHRVDKIRVESYVPEGNTALYDAIETTLENIPASTAMRQMVIILSDGEDVCSWTSLTACADRIGQAQQQGVLIVFLGDGDEALATAAVLGIPEHCRYQFTAREGLRGVFQLLTTQTVQALADVATRGLLPTQFFPAPYPQ
jgi:hypothetical protein